MACLLALDCIWEGEVKEFLINAIPGVLLLAWALYKAFVVGIDSSSTALGLLFSMVVVPAFFLLLYGSSYRFDLNDLRRLVLLLIRFVVVYGLINFVYGVFQKDIFDVPGLTSIFGSAVPLTLKHNDRGLAYKLVSTYGNGNVYGICMCMMASMYLSFESNKCLRWLFVASLLLTLSRTVWAGFFIVLVLTMLLERERVKEMAIYGFVFLIGAIATAFIFDAYLINNLANLGGRVQTLPVAPVAPVASPFAIGEMLYLTTYKSLGLISLALLIYSMTPVVRDFILTRRLPKNCVPYFIGVVAYIFIAAIDSAVLSFPVMFFFCGMNYLYFYSKYRVAKGV